MRKSMQTRSSVFQTTWQNVIEVTLTVEWLLVPDRVVWASQKLLISKDFHVQQSQSLQRMVRKKTKTSSEQQFYGQKHVAKGQTGQSWQEDDSNANNHALQQWYAEEHLWTHNASNL